MTAYDCLNGDMPDCNEEGHGHCANSDCVNPDQEGRASGFSPYCVEWDPKNRIDKQQLNDIIGK